MRSKTSCSEYFNATLFRRNLSRFWPLWGMASFLASLAPLAMLTQIIWNNTKSLEPLKVTEAYYNLVQYAVPVVSLLYAVLCAMAVWSYLYNARSVGLSHTLPIRREGLLVTNFLSGMAMLLIPYVFAGTLSVGIVTAMGGFDPEGTLVTIAAVIGLNFFYFSTATFVAFITSNVFALPALYFLFHFLAVALDALVGILSRNFLLGLVEEYSGAVEFLSPTVFFVGSLRYSGEYTEETVRWSDHGSYTHSVLTDIGPGNYWLIAVYALAGAGLLALVWALYRRRESERAGEVAAAKWMHPAFRALATVLCALIGGQLLYLLFWSGYQKGDFYDAVPLAVFMTLAGLIGYFAASMLLAKSLKVFHKKRLPGAVGAAVFSLALCLTLDADVLGLEKLVPETAELASVRLYVAENNYTLYPGQDDAVIEEIRTLHQTIAADRDYIVSDPSSGATLSEYQAQQYGWTRVNLTYEYQNGKTLRRSYSLTLNRDRMAQAGTYDNLLDALVNGEEMKLRRLHIGDEKLTVSDGWFYNRVTNYSTDLGTREAQELLEAARLDAEAGVWGTYDWFGDNDYADRYAVDLELSFRDREDLRSDSISIVVRKGMVNTERCLKRLGLATEKTLLTEKELNPGEYQDYRIETGPEETVYPEDAFAAAEEAAGVIGGADGPTEMYITNG